VLSSLQIRRTINTRRYEAAAYINSTKVRFVSLFDDNGIKRFWSKVAIAGRDDCWKWTGCLNNNGYGEFHVPGTSHKNILAHRAACELAHGPSNGLDCLHSCDTPPCCNPAHLSWGTHSRNMREAFERNSKIAQGLRHGRGLKKLLASQVDYMRLLYAAGFSCKELSGWYCVSVRAAWSHVRHVQRYRVPSSSRTNKIRVDVHPPLLR
jgi:HNH endonuclease